MRIELSAIREDGLYTLVTFTCAAGRGVARWTSVRPVPAVGTSLSVELELDREPDVDEERESRVAAAPPSLEVTDGGVLLTALVERVEEDGVALLRLSSDAILLVETAFGWAANDTVRLELDFGALALTPLGLCPGRETDRATLTAVSGHPSVQAHSRGGS